MIEKGFLGMATSTSNGVYLCTPTGVYFFFSMNQMEFSKSTSSSTSTIFSRMPFIPRIIDINLIQEILLRLSINRYGSNGHYVARFFETFIQLAYGFSYRGLLFLLKVIFRFMIWLRKRLECLDISKFGIVQKIGRAWELQVCLIWGRRLV